MIALLLFTISISCYHQQVQSDPIEYILAIGRKMSMLDNGLADTIQNMFYERGPVVPTKDNYPMLALVAEIAEMEMSLHKHEQDALSNSALVIEKYMGDGVSDSLIDLVVSRMIEQVSMSELDLEQDRRKKIYLLLRSYDHEPGVRKLALDYSSRVKAIEARALKAKALLDETLLRYQTEISGVHSDQKSTDPLQLVDDFIKETKASSVTPYQRDVLNEWMSNEIAQTFHEAQGRVKQLPEDEITAVKMDDVLAYENSMARSHLDSVMDQSYHRLIQLDDSFRRTIKEVFYEQQEMAKANGNRELMAFSARIAEAEALMYAIAERMLVIVREALKHYFVYRHRKLEGSLMVNSNLIDLIVQRSWELAIQIGFVQLEDYRKEVYVLLKKYEHSKQVKDLARRFFGGLRVRRREQARMRRDMAVTLKKYINDAMLVLPEPQVSIPKDVDQFINEALARHDFIMLQNGIWKKFAELNRTEIIHQFVEETLFEDIMVAKRVDIIDVGRLEIIDLKDVQAYEDSLL